MDGATESEALRWLEQALEQAPAERLSWLAAQALDAAVAARVRSMLAHTDSAGGFLETPAWEAAGFADASGVPPPGSRFGAWRVLGELGTGGMGIVLRVARADGAYDQEAALKLMRPAGPRQRDALMRRFANERRLLARLEHPNVVRILDGGSTGSGAPWLVMEYIEGQPLTAWCREQGLDVRGCTRLVAQICDGVQAAHQHLIVHRDLKPGNILVDAAGQPRVLDFGIARLLAEEGEDLTRTAFAAMTPAYASPEQLRNEPLTTASDVYSLGVILYELIAGALPHDLSGLSPAQVERTVGEMDPSTLRRALAGTSLPAPVKRHRRAQIDADLERIVARALHKDVARRYGTAQALAEDLRRYLKGQPVEAHPDSIAYRLRKFAGRHRLGVATATLTLGAVLAASGAALWQAGEARRAAADTARINDFLVGLISASDPALGGGELTLAAAVDRSATEVDERFGDRPDLAASIRYALGVSMRGRYALAAAERQLEPALADSERLFGPDDRRTVRVLIELAALRREQVRDEEALRLHLDALGRLERRGATRSMLYVDALNSLGVFHLVRREYAEAEVRLRAARDAAARATDRVAAADEQALLLMNLGQAVAGQERLAEAQDLYAAAHEIFEREFPDGSPQLATLLNNRARLARDLGKPDEALAFLQRSVPMHRASYPGDHVAVLVPTTNLARQALESGRPDLAVQPAEDAVAMADRLYPDSAHLYHAQALVTLAEVRVTQGRAVAAGELLQRAGEILARLDTASPPTQAYLERVRAALCAAPGDGAPLPPACQTT